MNVHDHFPDESMRNLLVEVLTENDPESLPSFPAQPCAPGPPLSSQPSPR